MVQFFSFIIRLIVLVNTYLYYLLLHPLFSLWSVHVRLVVCRIIINDGSNGLLVILSFSFLFGFMSRSVQTNKIPILIISINSLFDKSVGLSSWYQLVLCQPAQFFRLLWQEPFIIIMETIASCWQIVLYGHQLALSNTMYPDISIDGCAAAKIYSIYSSKYRHPIQSTRGKCACFYLTFEATDWCGSTISCTLSGVDCFYHLLHECKIEVSTLLPPLLCNTLKFAPFLVLSKRDGLVCPKCGIRHPVG